MEIGKAIYNILSTNSDVSTLVGTRIFPNVAPQTTTFPFIIYDVTGRLVLPSSFSGNGNNTIQLPHLKRGMYLVQVLVNKGIITKKLMLD